MVLNLIELLEKFSFNQISDFIVTSSVDEFTSLLKIIPFFESFLGLKLGLYMSPIISEIITLLFKLKANLADISSTVRFLFL